MKQTSENWYSQLYPNKEVKILDPDGWDRTNYRYSFKEELVTESEFRERLMMSTCTRIIPLSGKKN